MTSYELTDNKINTILDTLNHYKNIFTYNKNTNKHDKSIILLKKKEFDIFYSCKRKYPLLVVESITALTGDTNINEPPIDRRLIVDPFREDVEIPQSGRHTLDDYKLYMEYGISMGHNAPAGQHKTNLDIWYETFLLSNITPQEIVLNCGLWAIMENWCKLLGKNRKYTNIKIMTGSIPEEKDHIFQGIKMNIPLKMFKIVCFELVSQPGKIYMEIFITNNTAYYVNPNITTFDLTSFLVPNKSYEWFQNFSGINIILLLNYYGYNTVNTVQYIKPFRSFVSMVFNLYTPMKKLMKKSNWFGYLIYASSLSQLESKWEECKKFEAEFENLEYHREYYEITKQRLLRKSITKDKDLTSFKISQNKFKYTMQSSKSKHKHHKKNTHIKINYHKTKSSTNYPYNTKIKK